MRMQSERKDRMDAQRRQFSVLHGFIRLYVLKERSISDTFQQQSHDHDDHQLVPDLVFLLLRRFYGIRDYFASWSTKMALSQNEHYVDMRHQGMNWATAIGADVIDFERNPARVHYEWSITTNSSMIFIGLDSTPGVHPRKDSSLDHNVFNIYQPWPYYAWCQIQRTSMLVTNDKNVSYPKSWTRNIRGTIKLTVDLHANTISFTRNGQLLGVAFENIDRTRKYHLAVALYKAGSWAQIVDDTDDQKRQA
mmetsp:Transcript_27805/g.45862  ORF Transcript_27805/g.45862 Transcript_27805/m.45862 type:complete len:250 (+) Transcript_27805:46-795(+)